MISRHPIYIFSETNDSLAGILLTFGTALILLAGDAEKATMSLARRSKV